MTQRLRVHEGQTAEEARAVLDDMLSVAGWAVPGKGPKRVRLRDPKAPWWWTNAEDASDSNLKVAQTMGLSL